MISLIGSRLMNNVLSMHSQSVSNVLLIRRRNSMYGYDVNK